MGADIGSIEQDLGFFRGMDSRHAFDPFLVNLLHAMKTIRRVTRYVRFVDQPMMRIAKEHQVAEFDSEFRRQDTIPTWSGRAVRDYMCDVCPVHLRHSKVIAPQGYVAGLVFTSATGSDPKFNDRFVGDFRP
jgi:hypothetical protein